MTSAFIAGDLGPAVLECSEPIVVTRHLPSVVVKGRVQGRPVEKTFTVDASVQPMTQKELQRLPEGQRARGAVTVFSVTELKTVETSETRIPDRFALNGVNYQILSVDDWFSTAGFFKYVATRVER